MVENIERFLEVLASNEESRKLMDRVFSSECEKSEACKICVESTINYWYMKWLFGIQIAPEKVTKDMARCLEYARNEGEGET